MTEWANPFEVVAWGLGGGLFLAVCVHLVGASIGVALSFLDRSTGD